MIIVLSVVRGFTSYRMGVLLRIRFTIGNELKQATRLPLLITSIFIVIKTQECYPCRTCVGYQITAKNSAFKLISVPYRNRLNLLLSGNEYSFICTNAPTKLLGTIWLVVHHHYQPFSSYLNAVRYECWNQVQPTLNKVRLFHFSLNFNTAVVVAVPLSVGFAVRCPRPLLFMLTASVTSAGWGEIFRILKDKQRHIITGRSGRRAAAGIGWPYFHFLSSNFIVYILWAIMQCNASQWTSTHGVEWSVPCTARCGSVEGLLGREIRF